MARQLQAVVRLELRKNFLGRRGLGTYLLALLPVVITVIRLFVPDLDPEQVSSATGFYSIIYQIFTLRFALFVACVLVFGNMIRREVLDRTLHYYLLTPIRRELLVVAKYATGL